MPAYSRLSLLILAVVGAAAGQPRSSDAQVSEKWNRLGNLSPYHKAPVPTGVKEVLPADCKVDQVMLTGRHGSRYPLASELVFITNMTAKLSSNAQAISRSRLPKELRFLKNGYTSTLGHDDLTAIGRQELFDHGVNFRLRYQHLTADAILAGDQDRVIESAQWFGQGYFGRNWAGISGNAFSTIPEDNVTVSWITPMDTCPKWQYAFGGDAVTTWGNKYLPSITKRLNRLAPALRFTDADTHGALYACAYDYAALRTSPWCGVFTDQEIASFEYELDLLMNGAFGYNLPGDMGPALGSLYVNKLIERFSNSSSDAKAVYLEFGHDTTIDMALTALGLAKDSPPLSPTGPVRPKRKFRTSEQVPFAAQMVWEKFSCTSSFHGPQIRLILNDSPFPLTFCSKTSSDRSHGTCSFDTFVSKNSFSTSRQWGDAAWNATCGASPL
ncbi:Histidine phosphatase superfamily protein [Pleurotus pulmonarius]